MTNRNRKRAQQKEIVKTPVQKKKQPAQESRGGNSKLPIIFSGVASVVAVLALIVSIISLWMQVQYSQKEYEYKLDPEISVEGRMDFSIQVLENHEYDISLDPTPPVIQVLQKNNLQSAYLIHDNYEVEKLQLDEVDYTLNTGWQKQIDLNTPNLIVNGVNYHYEFILLEGLDGSFELYLLYSRDGRTDRFGTYVVSGVEILELEKGHMDEADHEGEKELAKLYQEVLANCQKYIVQ